MVCRWWLLMGALMLGCAGASLPTSSSAPLSHQDRTRVARLRTLAALAPLAAKVDGARLLEAAEGLDCPCQMERGSLADCAHRCPTARFALRSIVRQLAHKQSLQKIQSRLVSRYTPREREQLLTHNAPCRGPKDAKVTLVVFSDFQCPFCQRSVKLLEEVQHRAKASLRVCFKNLVVHATARLAAQAAVAAHRQGKFWPFHDLLFSDMYAQQQDDLEAYAKKTGLDLDRFKREMVDGRTKTMLLMDEMEGRKLKIRGTPAFYVNGRLMSDPKTVGFFLDWIEEAALVANATSQPTSRPVSTDEVSAP